MSLTLPTWPAEFPRSDRYAVAHGDRAVDVLLADGTHLCMVEATAGQPVELTVSGLRGDLGNAIVHPHDRAVQRTDGALVLRLSANTKTLIEPEHPGNPSLAVVVRVPTHAESPYTPGKLHDVGVITLRDHDHLHVPAGAILRGRVRIEGDGVRISGGGVLDLDHRTWNSLDGRAVVADCVRDLRIEGLSVVNSLCWMVLIGGSRDVTIRDVVLLGKGYTTDGIDVVGSSHVHASDGLIVGGDDCLVVKAFRGYDGGAVRGSWAQDVSDVTFERFLVGNHLAGSAMEIGHELAVDQVDRITFRDIEVAHVHDHGAVFSIHNADRAAVDDVLYERIRVNQCFDKLIDFRVVKSRWGVDEKRGSIGRVRLRDCDWHTRSYNAGHTVSVVGGWDAWTPAGPVVLDRFRIDGHPIEHEDELPLFTSHITGLDVRSD